MDYSLALKLEEAGFKKKSGAPIFIEDDVFPPTLSELIEALGDRFLNLYLTKGVFNCVNPFEDEEDTTGSTPEEAVANLWLELNKK